MALRVCFTAVDILVKYLKEKSTSDVLVHHIIHHYVKIDKIWPFVIAYLTAQ